MHSDFKDKAIYIKSKEFYTLIARLTDDEVPYALKDQITRSAISIVLNFSEGYGRFHKNDKKQFYITARASLNETIACFDLIQVHKTVPSEIQKQFADLAEEVSKMLSGLINTLK